MRGCSSALLYSGAGNTFYLVDNRESLYDPRELIQELTQVDGLILAEKSLTADAYMRVFNRDGSEAEMCGNGLRCLIHFLKHLKVERPSYRIESRAGQHEGWFVKDEICVLMSPPTNCHLHISEGIHFINTGVPHAVLFVEDLESIDVEKEGRALRHSPLFGKAGANVNFTLLNKEGSLAIRTYERGVEAETLACGTGSVAAALIACKLHHLPSPIEVKVRSGEVLNISFNKDWSRVTLQGPVVRKE